MLRVLGGSARVLARLALAGALAIAGAGLGRAAPPTWSDPAGYPGAWPAELATREYTSGGVAFTDLTGGQDKTKGGTANPSNSADFAGPSASSFYFAGDGTNLYFRLRLAKTPIDGGGSVNPKPIQAGTWSVFLDLDQNGFMDFALFLDGNWGSPSTPQDDLIVVWQPFDGDQIWDATSSWTGTCGSNDFAPANGSHIWQQDMGGVDDGCDGSAGSPADWDVDPTYGAIFGDEVDDLRRVRVTVIDLPQTNNSTVFLDFQVPLAALDNGAGVKVDCNTLFSMTAVTGNSNQDPLQKDILYNGDFQGSTTTAIPGGDLADGCGNLYLNPVVISATATTCSAGLPVTLEAEVWDLLKPDPADPTKVIDNLATVRFQYYYDVDADGQADDGGTWTDVPGTASLASGSFTRWQQSWDPSSLFQGQYLLRVYALDEDDTPRETYSDSQAPRAPVVVTFANDATCGAVVPTVVSGVAYEDANYSGDRESGEAGTGEVLHAKLNAGGGDAEFAAVVDTSTGAYSFLLAPAQVGTYDVLITQTSALTDTTPFVPAGWRATEITPNPIRAGVDVTGGATDLDFGFFHGSPVAGVVFRDDGTGGGTANNGVQDGGEPGIQGVTVELREGGAAVLTGVTDAAGAYAFLADGDLDGKAVELVETNPEGFLSTGADPGNTGGTYTRATDRLAWTFASGSDYAGADFGDVPRNSFRSDQARFVLPGATTFYPHEFESGSVGTLELVPTAIVTPSLAGFAVTLLEDANCDKEPDGEAVFTGPVSLAAGQKLCLLAKVTVPAGPPAGAIHDLDLVATYTYTAATPGLQDQRTLTDLTTVGDASSLELVKEVDKLQAKPGEVLTYTLRFENTGQYPLSNLVIQDRTPFATTFATQTVGPLPGGLAAPAVTTPGVGSAGEVRWEFGGSLAGGSKGSVEFQVSIDP